MKKKLIALIIFLFGITIGILAKCNLLTSIDTTVYNLIISTKSDVTTNVFKIITELGSTRFIVLLNIIIVIVSAILKNNKLLKITINSIISPIVNNILKAIFRRPRPEESLRLVNETNFSFPSGHAMISIFFYLTIIILINKSNFKCKNILNLILLLIIILIGISRIYLGVHYFSDVIGGYLIAVSIIVFLESVKGDGK